MTETGRRAAPEILREFVARVRDERWSGLQVTYRVAGGMPSQRRLEEFRIEGSGAVEGRVSDMRRDPGGRAASLKLKDADTHELLRVLASGLVKLARQPAMRFPPDALVGSVTVDVEGKKATLYFAPEEAAWKRKRKPPVEVRKVREAFRHMLGELFADGEQG